MVLKPVNNIQFHYLVEQFPFKDRNRLKSFIGELIRKEGHKVDHINYIFCSDDYLHQLNKSHLKHDTLTDIITFRNYVMGYGRGTLVYIWDAEDQGIVSRLNRYASAISFNPRNFYLATGNSTVTEIWDLSALLS